MGLMSNGVWQEHEPETSKDGHFERRDTAFRNWITPDGRPGPTGQDGFRAPVLKDTPVLKDMR